MRESARWRTPMLLRAYARVTAMAAPLTPLLMRRRLEAGKEDPERINERRGIATRERPAGSIAWLHGASVGEFLSIMPLVHKLEERGMTVLVTTVTKTAAALAAKRLPPTAIHQYMPWDVPGFVDRFLNHWQPDIAIFAESELWPNLILRTTARGIPLIQVNGRLSENSYKGWRRVPRVIGALLSRFDLCLTQTAEDAQRFSALGAPRVETTGNLKFDVPAPGADPVVLSALTTAIGGRPVMLAASTHDGEDEIVIAAHRSIEARVPGLLTIIAPRHPERGGRIAALANSAGFRCLQRSQNTLPGPATRLYIADTIGEMGVFYRVASIAVLGGSFITHGGQNPIEPAKLDVPLLHGPHVFNFAAVYAALDEAGAACVVSNSATLATEATGLLTDRDRAKRQIDAASGLMVDLSGALDRTISALDPYLIDLKFRARS